MEYCPTCKRPYESKPQQTGGTRNSKDYNAKSGSSRLNKAVEEILELSKVDYKTSITIYDHWDRSEKGKNTSTKKTAANSDDRLDRAVEEFLELSKVNYKTSMAFP